MGDILDPITGLASPWAYLVVGLLAAAETAAFIGLAVPGEAAMLLGGLLAFHGHVDLLVMMAVAALGAIAGDTISFQLGRAYGDRLKRSRLGRHVGEKRWARGQAQLQRRGGRAVFAGRFISVLRTIVPALAGIARMPYRVFLPWDIAGALLWAPGFVLAGYLAGGSYQLVERVAGGASLFLLALAIVLAAIAWPVRWISRHPERVRALYGRQISRPGVIRLRERYQPQLAFLTNRLHPEAALGLSLTVTLLALTGAGWAFGAVLEDVIARDELFTLNQPVARFVVTHREPWLTTVLQVVTAIGSITVLVPLIGMVGLAWWRRDGSWRPLGMLAAAYVGAAVLSNSIKLLIGEHRPPAVTDLAHATGYAFPSGHTTAAAAVYGMLAILVAASTPTWSHKVSLCAAATALVVLVGASRLYLGAHWLTDVLGGLTLGVVWTLTLVAFARWIADTSSKART
ncbi:MAG: bifunctional DedA family/phosphatase PAP2 family protein [Micromonosporaceae bacterium]